MAALALLCACSSERELSTGEPSFYRSMAAAGAQVDAATAASMISGYRTNNGLTAVTVDPALMKMAEARRTAFVLFEIEGLSGDEIARIQDIPLNTVWTRLHHARREFFALAAKYQHAHGKVDKVERTR